MFKKATFRKVISHHRLTQMILPSIFIENMHSLSDGSEYNMTNIFRVSDFLTIFFTSLLASEITVKYEKRGKYWSYCTR